MERTELEKRFTRQNLTEEKQQAVTNIENMYLRMAIDLCELVPGGRQQAVMLTKLEESKMWATKGIAES